jgi:hypothetical protein
VAIASSSKQQQLAGQNRLRQRAAYQQQSAILRDQKNGISSTKLHEANLTKLFYEL